MFTADLHVVIIIWGDTLDTHLDLDRTNFTRIYERRPAITRAFLCIYFTYLILFHPFTHINAFIRLLVTANSFSHHGFHLFCTFIILFPRTLCGIHHMPRKARFLHLLNKRSFWEMIGLLLRVVY